MNYFLTIFSIYLVLSDFYNLSSHQYYSDEPRIITDYGIIMGSDGVPIDYSYNETTRTNDSHLGSVPGCPKSIDGFPWIYYGEPAKCFLSGQRGPCRSDEKLLLQLGSTFGLCGCACLLYVEDKNTLETTDRYIYCQDKTSDTAPHGQIFDTKEKRCYNVFQEGTDACEASKAITDWANDKLTCSKLCTWWQINKEAGCVEVPTFSSSGVPNTQIVKNCPVGWQYSKILRICVRKGGSINIFQGKA